ncbi:hypothetical protein J3E74DRAFT_287879 [Bipolaris maydis]|nr:hypothetical protein J3E74DRAFT_287879 [Bipolaris maydis]
MADQAARRRMLAKGQKPSRLRHEVRPDSAGDKRESHNPVVQEPHSDVVIPDSQSDPSRHAKESLECHHPTSDLLDVPLSPNSLATLNRFGASKKISVLESDSAIFKTFTKNPLEFESASVFAPHVFSHKPPTVQRSSVSSANQESSRQESHDNPPLATTAAVPLQGVTALADDVQESKLVQAPELPSSSTKPPASRFSVKEPETIQKEITLPLPPPSPTVTEARDSTRKNTNFKKYKEHLKKSPTQRVDGTWPLLQNHPTGYIQKFNNAGGAVPNEFTQLPDFSLFQTHNSQSQVLSEVNVEFPLFHHDHKKLAPYCQTHEKHAQKEMDTELGTVVDDETRDVPRSMPLGLSDTSTQRAVATSTLQPLSLVSGQLHIAETGEQPLPASHDETKGSQCKMGSVSHQDPISSEKARNDTVPHSINRRSNQHENQSQGHPSDNSKRSIARIVASRDVLHGTSGWGRSDHVTKPRGNPRGDTKSTSKLFGASTSPAIERSVEDLRLAFLAESFRKHHEYTTQLENSQEQVATLLQQVDRQKEIIADYTKQRDEQKKILSSLTSKAKTNQKFLEGLQNDYEKLKKLATMTEEHSKKVLYAKITELEDERQDIVKEFETTTYKLSNSQRKMRAVADELHVQLAVANSVNKTLNERLNKLEAEYTSEKNKREKIENEVFGQVQSLQSQFNDGSNLVAKKLELFQTLIEKAATHNPQNIKIEECLKILNDLQRKSLLTLEDVHKAEGVLRFVQDRIESRLEDFSQALVRSAPSDTDFHVSIKEQIDDLRTNMMKYEEIAAENRKINDSNTALTKQLIAQQHESSRLSERVEHLQQVEIDLKERSRELERDLNDLRIATDSSLSEMSASEKLNHDLRKRLKEVESELRSASENIHNGEQLRHDLQKEAIEFKKRLEAAQKEREKAVQEQIDENVATIRDSILKEYELKLVEKEREYVCEINRLQLNLGEKEMLHRNVNERLSTANEQVVKLKKELKDQHREKTELQSQISQQQSDIKVLRQETDDRISQIERDAQIELQSSQERIKALNRENQALISKLEKGRVDEQRAEEVETSLQAEKNRLQEELRKLCSVLDDKNKEMTQIRNEAADENRKLIEAHSNDVQDYRRRLAETKAMLEEVEAKGTLLEDEYQARIEADRKAAEFKLLALEKEFGNALQEAKDQSAPSQWHSTRDTTPSLSKSQSDQNITLKKPRRKVNRDNRSVIEATQEQTGGIQFPPPVRAEISQAQSIDPDLFSVLFDDRNSAQIDGIDSISTFDHGLNTVPETQDLGDLTLPQIFFPERTDQAAQEDISHRALSSTELTSIGSEELTQMEKEVEFVSRPKFHEQGFNSNKPGKRLDTGKANTSSRMMPRGCSSQQIQTPNKSRVTRIKLPSHRERFDDILKNLSDSDPPYTRKRDRSQTERDSTSKRQRVLPAARSGASSPGSQKSSCPRSRDHSFETQSRTRTQVSPDKTYKSHGKASLQPYTALPTRRSGRVTRSKSRNGTAFGDDFSDRFNEELQGWH